MSTHVQSRSRGPTTTAFTLIEIMIAITIFGVVLIAIYSSWTAILRGSKVGLTAAAEAQRTRMALRAIEEALGSAQMFVGNIKHYSFLTDTSGDFAALSFVARLPSSFPGSGLFGDQSLRRVEFTVADNQLLLRQMPLLEAPEKNAQPYTIVLAPSVSLFALEFFDTNKFEWVPEWTATNRLPRMVRVALSFGQKGSALPKRDDIAIHTVFLSSMAIPRELQLPPGRMIGGRPGIDPATGQPLAPQPGLTPPQPGAIRNPNDLVRPPQNPAFRGGR